MKDVLFYCIIPTETLRLSCWIILCECMVKWFPIVASKVNRIFSLYLYSNPTFRTLQHYLKHIRNFVKLTMFTRRAPANPFPGGGHRLGGRRGSQVSGQTMRTSFNLTIVMLVTGERSWYQPLPHRRHLREARGGWRLWWLASAQVQRGRGGRGGWRRLGAGSEMEVKNDVFTARQGNLEESLCGVDAHYYFRNIHTCYREFGQDFRTFLPFLV